MPPAGADMNRKRPSEGAADNNRLQKRRSQGFTAPSSNSASAGESDLTALISVADASRRYDEWKGDIGDGVYRTLTGGGAYFPTNYKLFLKHPAPWLCPLVDCRKSFAQCSSLGHHFSKAHRGVKLYDDAERGLFHPQGKRNKPDKDGKLRPIVVARGFGAPGSQDDRQAPDASAAITATAAPASTTARAINSSISAPVTPAQATQPSPRKVIDISSGDEGVNPVVKDSSVWNTGSRVLAQQEQVRGRTKSTTGTANRVRKNGHSAVFEVNNPQELGGAPHYRNLFASWEQEAGAQRRKKISSKTGREVNKRQPKDASSNASQKVGTQDLEDPSSASSSEDDDDSDPFEFEPSDLPVFPKNATQQQRSGNTTSPIVVADSKRPSDPSRSAIWRYLMTLTKTDMPVPDDPAITELLALPRRRNLPRTWQRKLSEWFGEINLRTLTGLILYIGGDEASSSPCKRMGCSDHAEAHVFWTINFYHGSFIDHRYPFPKCVFLPNHFHDSVPITERLGHHLCCNSYYRSWKKLIPWIANRVPNDDLKAERNTALVDDMQNHSINKSAGTELSTNTPGNTPNSATSTSKTGDNAVQPSPSQASLPACPSLQPATMVCDTATPRDLAPQSTSRSSAAQVSLHVNAPPSSTTRNDEEKSKRSEDFSDPGQSSRIGIATSTIFSQLAVAMQQTVSPRRATQAHSAQPLVTENVENEPNSERSLVGSELGHTGENNPETLRSDYDKEGKGLELTSKDNSHLWINDVKRKMKEKKIRRKAKRQQEGQAGARQHSPTSQAQATAVSAAASSLSNLTVQDTSTAPSRSPQQGDPEQSQKTTVFNLASGSTQSIGFKGQDSQLLQASRSQTLECTVWAGSVRIKMIGGDGMSITRRVNAEGTWTVGPDSHCLISNFFPAAKETAVVNVKSKSVLTSIE